MVNRRYEKKKEVKFGNGTGSPLSDHYFLSACSEISAKFTLKVRNSQVKLRKLAFFLKKIKTEYP